VKGFIVQDARDCQSTTFGVSGLSHPKTMRGGPFRPPPHPSRRAHRHWIFRSESSETHRMLLILPKATNSIAGGNAGWHKDNHPNLKRVAATSRRNRRKRNPNANASRLRRQSVDLRVLAAVRLGME